MQPIIWYAAWLDRPAELRDHAAPTRASGRPTGTGVRRRVGRALIELGSLLAAETTAPAVARSSR